MNISIISVFPEIHETFFKTSIIGKAVEKGIIHYNIVRFSDVCEPKERIDEPTCGHGAGMIIKPEVMQRCIELCEQKYGKGYKIFFSPQGKKLSQTLLQNMIKNFVISDQPVEPDLSSGSHLILVCPRYEGIDERVVTHYADLVISIGDYIVMGGDLPAQVFLESFLRYIPGIVGKEESVEHESFSASLLDHPVYGLPVTWQQMTVPDIVLSGNHGAIDMWREDQALEKTLLHRFDWFVSRQPDRKMCDKASKKIPSHYVALMHTQINVKEGRVGETSLASIDIHDLARSSSTYGIKKGFIVSALQDQHIILDTFLDFWRSGRGKKYNDTRHKAMSIIDPAYCLDEVVEKIEKIEGKKPLLIATSAKNQNNAQHIDYYSQGLVWQSNRPVLLLFGTGQGLSDAVLDQCDYLLLPIYGLTDYNHLSVRSAIAVILDRWLGLHPKTEDLFFDKKFKN